jgi:hypothetical protein
MFLKCYRIAVKERRNKTARSQDGIRANSSSPLLKASRRALQIFFSVVNCFLSSATASSSSLFFLKILFIAAQ